LNELFNKTKMTLGCAHSEELDKEDDIAQRWDFLANTLVHPLHLACKANSGRLMETALDCVQVS